MKIPLTTLAMHIQKKKGDSMKVGKTFLAKFGDENLIFYSCAR